MSIRNWPRPDGFRMGHVQLCLCCPSEFPPPHPPPQKKKAKMRQDGRIALRFFLGALQFWPIPPPLLTYEDSCGSEFWLTWILLTHKAMAAAAVTRRMVAITNARKLYKQFLKKCGFSLPQFWGGNVKGALGFLDLSMFRLLICSVAAFGPSSAEDANHASFPCLVSQEFPQTNLYEIRC